MDLNKFIYNAQNMPTIPEVVQELIESLSSNHIDSQKIARKVSMDPAMTAKVLRMANSAKYGGHRQIGSVNEAVVLLGMNALRTIVLASGLTRAFIPPEGFDIRAFWKKSFSIACLSHSVAKLTPHIDAEVAFTCGMLFDVGGLIIRILANPKAVEIDQAIIEGSNRISAEARYLGFTYPEVGAELAHRWKFPESIVEGILHQLDPGVTEDDYKALAGILFLANFLYDFQDEDIEELLSHFPFEHSALLGIDKSELCDKLEQLRILNDSMEAFVD